MIGLLCFVVAVLASPFKSKIRLEAENAALRHQLVVLRRKLRAGLVSRTTTAGSSFSSIVGFRRSFLAAFANVSIRARLSELGASALPGSPTQFRRFIMEETEKYAGVIRSAKIAAR
jgi:hypothetical protein